MRYKRFEDLPVWNTAIDLAVSVSNNIAEGFERGTNNELLMFLYIARGSAGEVRSMCCLVDRLPSFTGLNRETSAVKSKAESCSKQLKAWAEALQNSDYKGERYVTEKLKRSDQATREREEFLKELLEIRKKDAASRN